MPWCQGSPACPPEGDHPACPAVDLRYGAFGWLGDGLLGLRAGEEPEWHKQDADGGDQAGAGEAVHERGRGVGETAAWARQSRTAELAAAAPPTDPLAAVTARSGSPGGAGR